MKKSSIFILTFLLVVLTQSTHVVHAELVQNQDDPFHYYDDVDFTEVVHGGNHTMAVTADQRVFTWGDNTYGQLGNGTTNDSSLPVEITSFFNFEEDETIVALDVGKYHSAIVTDHRLYVWGYNAHGQLGLGSNTDKLTPTTIPDISLSYGESIIDIQLGASHTMILTSNGNLYSFGLNDKGQLGINSTLNQNSPNPIKSNFGLAFDETIVAIKAGYDHSAALTSHNRLFLWGKNYIGQIGDGTTENKLLPTEITNQLNLTQDELITDVALSLDNSMVLTSNNRVFSWGYNSYGTIGDGTTNTSYIPIDISHQFILETDETITDIELSRFHGGVLTSQGTVYSWGLNDTGQVGNNSTTFQINTPIKITSHFDLAAGITITDLSFSGDTGFAISSDNKLYAWGSNYGVLGLGDIVSRNAPHRVYVDSTHITRNPLPIKDKIVDVETGGGFSFALTETGNLFSWGNNSHGQLADGTNTQAVYPIEVTDNFQLNENEAIVSLKLGQQHGVLLTSESRVLTWGHNEFSSLGDTTNISRSTPVDITENFSLNTNEVITDIAVGSYSSFALTSDFRVLAWGDNFLYTLGDGTRIERATPVDITNNFDLNPNEYVAIIRAGGDFSGAITSQNRVFTWGNNSGGQLGTGDTLSQSIPVDITQNIPISSGVFITDLALGSSHAFGIADQGEYFAWGTNTNGQLGLGTTNNELMPVVFTGSLNYGAKQFILGNRATFILSDYVEDYYSGFKQVDATGSNLEGVLGTGIGGDTLTPIDISASLNLALDETIIKVDSRGLHTVLLTSFGRVFTWGRNMNGQLGDGTTENKYTPNEITNLMDSSITILNSTTQSHHYDTDDYITITLYPEYEIVDDIDSIRVDGTYYDTITQEDGKIEVTIPNNASSGDHVIKMLQSMMFINGNNIVLNGDIYPSYNIIEDVTPPSFDPIADQIYEVNQDDVDWSTLIVNMHDNSNGTLTPSEVNDAVDYTTPGTYSVTVSLSDKNQNTSSETFNVQIVDTTSPIITLIGNADLTLEVGTAYNEPGAVFSDNYGVNENITISGSVDTTTVGTYTVEYNLTDIAGNIADTVIRTVHVVDTTQPTFDIDDQTIEVGSLDIDWTTMITNTSDNYSTELTLSEDSDLVDYDTLGTYDVTVSVTDQAGNTTPKTITVTVVDREAPDITLTGDETVYVEYEGTYTEPGASCTDNYDTTCDVIITGSVDTSDLGTYTITYTATDSSGNETVMTRTVVVQDTTAPVITLNGDSETTLEVGSTYNELGATFTDNYGVKEDITITGTVDSMTVGTYTISYDLTDMEGNIAETVTRTIHIVDTTQPTFDIVDQTIEVGSLDIDWTTMITNASDNYSTELTLSEDSDLVDYDTLGTYDVTVSVTDQAGNTTPKTITVTVVDTEAPTFNISDQTIEAGVTDVDWTAYVENAQDNYSTELTMSITEDTVLYNAVGSYTVTIEVSDGNGNETSKTINVTVEDTTSPVIEMIPNQTIESGAYTEYDWTTLIEATDNSVGSLATTIEEDNIIYNQPGTYEVIVSVTDASGNSSETSFVVEVIDTTPPTFDITIEAGIEDIDWTTLMTDMVDNSEGSLLSQEVEDNVQYNVPGDYTVLLSLKDESDNIAYRTINVTVQDTTNPEVVLNPSLDSIEVGTAYTEYGITAHDVTDTEVLIDGNVDTDTPGTYTLTYEVTDTSGNKTMVVRYVTVYEKQHDITFSLESAQTTINVGESYEDTACTITINGTDYECTVKENTVNSTSAGIYTITYTYTYEGTEYTYDRYVFVVEDSQPLVLYTPYRKEEDWV